MPSSTRKAITLLEVLVVLAVIGILIALILPAVVASREAARRVRCASNLKQIGLAINSYAAANGVLPLGYTGPGNGFSFLVEILPYLDQRPLYNSLNMDTGARGSMAAVALSVYLCPSDGLSKSQPLGITNYAGNQGEGVQSFGYNGAFSRDNPIAPQAFTDGMSTTAAVSEWLVGPNAWGMRDPVRSAFTTLSPVIGKDQLDLFASRCRNLDLRTAPLAAGANIGSVWFHGDFGHSLYNHTMNVNENSCLNGGKWQEGAWTAKSNHPGVANTLFADGHVRCLRQAQDLSVWRSLGSRNGGEVVDLDGF